MSEHSYYGAFSVDKLKINNFLIIIPKLVYTVEHTHTYVQKHKYCVIFMYRCTEMTNIAQAVTVVNLTHLRDTILKFVVLNECNFHL